MKNDWFARHAVVTVADGGSVFGWTGSTAQLVLKVHGGSSVLERVRGRGLCMTPVRPIPALPVMFDGGVWCVVKDVNKRYGGARTKSKGGYGGRRKHGWSYHQHKGRTPRRAGFGSGPVARAGVPSTFMVIPVKDVKVRVAKYDVALREAPLWATLAMHTILSRMVMFRCDICDERMPTFHPAYRPPRDLDLCVLRSACKTDVARWEESPPFDESEEDLRVAKCYHGRCMVCHLDIRKDMQERGLETEAFAVPMRGADNRMDPCWNFPHEELRDLFASATVNEAMFIALEHMQLDFVTVRSTGLRKFRKNIISFPQDLRKTVVQHGMLREFKICDRVNSVRGPGEDLERQPKRAQDASDEERCQFSVDSNGCLVYPATVRAVDGPHKVSLEYDCCKGVWYPEYVENVTSRVQMPWHPRKLHGKLVIMLTRNVPHGDPIEGLEVRWGVVCNILRALTACPHIYRHLVATPWREGEDVTQPMHKWYNLHIGMFDVLTEAECRHLYAPRFVDGVVVGPEEAAMLGSTYMSLGEDLRTPDDMLAAGLDVRSDTGDDSDLVDGVVEKDDFQAWIMLKGLVVASELYKWWLHREVEDEGAVEGWKITESDTCADFFDKIRDSLFEGACLEHGKVTVSSLAQWCRRVVGEGFGGDDFPELADLVEYMKLEFRIVRERHSNESNSGGMENGPDRPDIDVEARETASVVAGVAGKFNWHGVSGEPSAFNEEGRFEKAHPLEFPMGIGGLYDSARKRHPTVAVWAQHILRLWGGTCVHGLRGHRLVWAVVNTVLLSETRGKGFAVQRIVMRRMGASCADSGDAPLTRAALRAALQSEETAGSLVNTLMTVGRSVRSTPMHWVKESTELDCAAKHMSWTPPWVRPCVSVGEFNQKAPPWCYLGGNEMVKDSLGRGTRGRIPATWWTLNFRYNFDDSLHRLNVGGDETVVRKALAGSNDLAKSLRFGFVRDSPDILVYVHALRAELHMRMVMPAVLGGTDEVPFFGMARMETGGGPNCVGIKTLKLCETIGI